MQRGGSENGQCHNLIGEAKVYSHMTFTCRLEYPMQFALRCQLTNEDDVGGEGEYPLSWFTHVSSNNYDSAPYNL